MKMDLLVNLTQEQKLKLTHEMQLSIKVLQMPINELREYIDKEFQENPILDLKEGETSNLSERREEKDKIDHKELIKYLEFDNYSSYSYGDYSNDENEISPFMFISEKKSLKEFLHEQILEENLDKYQKIICDYIIENLDGKGYLEVSINDICNELNIKNSLGEECLNIIQNLEPYGIGARNLKECLTIQLTKLNLMNDILKEIIENYLQEVADAKYNLVGKELNISPREAQRYGDIIRKLEPKPSRGFYTGEEVNFVIPDAQIRKINGEHLIIMNDSLIPKLSINEEYKKIIRNEENGQASDYVKEKINKAMFLIKSVEQRRNTLYRVLEKVIEKQNNFFENGKEALTPMTLKEISEELALHESTISRAIKEKYILTDFGTIKIKDLFINGITSKSGDDTGILTIKNMIKELVESEDRRKPLSDQYISDELNKKNVNISRRTVAKYREEMGIKSSSKRKRI
ncbi:MAG: RNA polymerase factor sigma-54 [Clostridium sp.]